jgi:hypothetical protein
MRAEINHDFPQTNDGPQIIAQIDAADDLQFGLPRGAGNERLTHAAFGPRDDNTRHEF